LLGLGYLIIATQVALAWFSWESFSNFQSQKPWGNESVFVILGIVAVYGVICREIRFLATTDHLRYAGFADREEWLKTKPGIPRGD
jgi:hypothetical protein